MARRQAARLGDLLIEAGALTKAQLDSALNMQHRIGGRLGSTLIEMGIVDERTIANVLAQQLQIPSATAAQLDRAAKGALERVTRALAERLRVVPVRVDDDRLWVAMVDPTDEAAIGELERESGLTIKPMIVPDVLIDFALGKHYGVQRRARFIEARNADLLETGSVPVYDPHNAAEHAHRAGPIGFLDENKPRAAPPRAPGLPPIPTAKKPPPPPSSVPSKLRTRLLAAQSRDDVYQALLDELVVIAPRLVVLLLRDGMLAGQSARAIDPRVLIDLRIEPSSAPTLAHVLAHGQHYVGPLPSQLEPVFPSSAGARSLVMPLTIGRKPVGLIIGAPVADSRPLDLSRTMAMADIALHIAHLRTRLAAE